jgi:HAD superfamily hydrolase (TIGR01509 family)
MPKIKAVVFDLDGTLADSKAVILGAFKYVLGVYNLPYDEAEVSSHVGKRLDHTYASLIPDEKFETLLELHRNWQADNRHLLRGFKGLNDFLTALKSKKVKLGIFTSALKARTMLALEDLNIRQYFDVVVDGEDVTRPKPNREGLELIASRLDVSLDQIVVVGDAKHDIASGKQAGVITIGVTHGFGTRQELQAAGADYIVNNLTELLDTLKQLI